MQAYDEGAPNRGHLKIPMASPHAIETIGMGDETGGNPHRAQISPFELFELSILV